MDPAINPSDLIDARQAVKLLGIKLPTLYAYVSRGLLRSVGGTNPRKRLYVRAEVERLKTRHEARAGHTAVAAGALRWGEPVLDTSISGIAPEGPLYRGHSAVGLAENNLPFEEVAELLWESSVAERPSAGWVDPSDPPSVLLRRLPGMLPARCSGLIAMQLVCTTLGAADTLRHGAPAAAERARARRLIRYLGASLALAGEPAPTSAAASARLLESLRQPSLAKGVAVALGLRPKAGAAVLALNQALVLSADHELNTSTFAARIAASAGADLYGCLQSALATAAGSRHGGSADRIEAFLQPIGSPAQAEAAVQQRFARGEEVTGFHHTLYPRGDPRSQPLLERARELAPRSREVKVAFAIIEAMRSAGHPPPAIDYALVVLCRALGLPAGSATSLFALGRTAGWVAHILEQREAGFLLRPRARYVGRGAISG